MLDLTDEQKRLFYTGGNFKDYVFYFPEIGLKITNDIIHQEAVTIKQSICDEQELKLGGCLASSIEFEVSEIMEYDLTGLEFSATLYVNLRDDGTYDLKIPMGVYRVDSCKLVDDKDYKKVIAYDALYDASVDVSEWYRSILPSNSSAVTLKAFRESLLEHLGMSYAKQNLINDNVFIEKTIEPSDGSMTGTSVLKLICELNGGFGKINRDGLFEVINVHGLGLFPEEDLYPEETLYPEDHFQYMGMSDDNSYPEYKTTKYEEYMCPAPTCVTVKSTDDDYGTTSGEDLRNPYLISGNYLLYGKSATDLQKIAENILEKINFITYRPNTTQLWGLPYMDTGDVFALEKRNDDIESYVFTRTLSGVQGLWDTYEAKGNEIRDNKVSANTEIIQLKGKSLILKKSIDGVSSELTNFENQTSSKFEQTDTAISAEVTRASNAEEKLSGRIAVEADKIEAEVTRATKAEDGLNKELSGKIKVEANNITAEVIRATKAEEDLSEEFSGKITVEADRITEEVASRTKGDKELSGRIDVAAGQVVLKADANGKIVAVELTADTVNGTEFKVEADNISLTAEEAIDLLAGGTLSLSGKNINIESDNFSVDSDGKVVANAINIEGGEIKLDTSNSPENLIILRNLEANVKDVSGNLINIRFFSEKPPRKDNTRGAEIGDFFLDLSTNTVYQLTEYQETIPIWTQIPTQSIVSTWYENRINTEDGFSITQYTSKNNSKNIGGAVSVHHDGIVMDKFFVGPTGYETDSVSMRVDLVDAYTGPGGGNAYYDIGFVFNHPVESTMFKFVSDPDDSLSLLAYIDADNDGLNASKPIKTKAKDVTPAGHITLNSHISMTSRQDQVVSRMQTVAGEYEQVFGTAVFTIDTQFNNFAFYLSTPGIVDFLPYNLGNGDYNAIAGQFISPTVNAETEYMSIQLPSQSFSIGVRFVPFRVNYSYWRKA